MDECQEKYKFRRDINREQCATMNEMIEYEEEKRNSEIIMEKDKESTEICDFKVGNKDDNCGGYREAQKLDADARKMKKSMFCVIFMKLIAKTKELMRKHDARLFKVDDDQRDDKLDLETKFSSENGIQDWNERLWTRGVLSGEFWSEVRMTDSKSWVIWMPELVRNGVMKESANAFMKRLNYGELKLIQKFMRMKVVLDIG